MPKQLEQCCAEKVMKMTEQRRVVARVLSSASNHPDIETVFTRAARMDRHISVATVYRTVELFEEANIIERHDFGDERPRFEERPEDKHDDHLTDVRSCKVIEFTNSAIEALQVRMADQLGYKLIGHPLELYAVPLDRRDGQTSDRKGKAELKRRTR